MVLTACGSSYLLELKVLEDSIEQSLQREEDAMNGIDKPFSSPVAGDTATLQKKLKEQQAKHEVCNQMVISQTSDDKTDEFGTITN